MMPPDARVYSSLPDRFWAKVDKSGPIPEHRPDLGQCWLWTGARLPSGYGYFRLPTQNGLRRNEYPHRLSYEAAYGPIPPKYEVDHLCRTKSCVNPAHLEAVTKAENCLRWAQTITHCPAGHLYDAENTLVQFRGKYRLRNCRACIRESRLAYRQQNRAQIRANDRRTYRERKERRA
jgi:hypothetical protein